MSPSKLLSSVLIVFQCLQFLLEDAKGLNDNPIARQCASSFNSEDELVLNFVDDDRGLLVLDVFQIFGDVFDALVAEVALVCFFDLDCVSVPVIAVHFPWAALDELFLLLSVQLLELIRVESDDWFHAHQTGCDW